MKVNKKIYKNRCQNCSQKLAFDYTQAGKVECPTCGGTTTLTIPQPNKFVKTLKICWDIVAFFSYTAILVIFGVLKWCWNNLMGCAGVAFISLGCGLATISVIEHNLSIMTFLPVIALSWVFGFILLIVNLVFGLKEV